MTASGRRIGLTAVCLMLPALLAAQTLPLPTLPPQEPRADPSRRTTPTSTESPEAPPDTVTASTRPRPWEYGFGMGVGWDSNISIRGPDGPDGLGLSPRANLARTSWSPKGQFRLGASGRWVGYPEYKELSRWDADVAIDWSHRPSVGTSWHAGAAYTHGYSDTSRVLSEQGVLLPLVQTRTLSGSLGVTRSLGRRSSLRVDGRVYGTLFDQSEAGAASLVDGLSFRGTAGLHRATGSRNTLALVYSVEAVNGRELAATSEAGDDSYLTHYGSLQWSRLLSPRHGFLLEAGASYTREAAQAGLQRSEGFFGGASYSREVKRSRVTVYARREVAPAFGLGVSRVESRFGINATIPLGRDWTVRLAGSHVEPDTPEAAAGTYSAPDDVSFVLERRLGRQFQMSAESRYLRRGATSVSPVSEAFRVGLFLSLVSPF
jgi:hypothetical protein